MARALPFSIALVVFTVGCGTTWKVDDIDGDGVTPAEGDCWDSLDPVPGFGVTGDEIHPGAKDAWYDGLDQNCDGADDFDADGDGYVPADFIGEATFGVEGSGVNHPPQADCWDADVSADPPAEWIAVDGYPQPTPDLVNPGAEPGHTTYAAGWDTAVDGWADFWYDGIDLNCDEVDDFDQDGDGFRSQYHPDQSGVTGDDCIDGSDLDDVNPAGTDAADVNPDAAETWWDGTDQDCDYADTVDCDKDADGFRGDPTVAIEELDDSACAFEDDESIDCNDEIDSVYPTDAEEIFYNGTDDNCDYADRDGDKDGDGGWAMDYAVRLGDNEVDTSTVTPPASPGDCWDDPEWDDLAAGSATGFTLNVKDGFTALTASDVKRDHADRPYDGADQDCRPADYDGNGADDDFDWDGDGYTVEIYEDLSYQLGDDCLDCPAGCFDGSWTGTETQDWCDDYCADQDDNPGDIDPAEINSGVDPEYDIAYDGTDQNCDDWSDWDYDRDGEVHMNAAAYGGPSGGTDCHEGSDITTGLSIDDTLAYPNPAGLQPSEINSAAAETWYDGTDQDCDAWPSDDDADKDGQEHEAQGGDDCFEGTWKDVDTNPGGVAPALIKSGVAETWYDGTDQDCDDWSDDDADRDGQDHEEQGGTDCYEGTALDEDGNPAGIAAASIRTGATDTWYDGTDADCDDNDGDADGDGHYIDSYAYTQHAATAYPVDDCDDTDSAINPDETEIAGDQVDTDCDTRELCYDDADDDGYRLTSTRVSTDVDCTDSGEAVSGDPTGDCDDTDALEYPSATEICDGQDNDCDGTVPSNEIDNDSDGYVECTIHSAGWDADAAAGSKRGDDCDDTDANDHPDATETVGNQDDEDCDGAEICYVDADNDGYRPDATSTVASADTDCTDSGEAVSTDPTTDCDDTDANDYPGATETVGNNDDEDCDGGEICYVDADNDGYRTTTGSTITSSDTDCTDSGEAVATDPATDCDDSDANDYPGAAETVGNNDDEDCDGREICYVDVDNDGYRPDATSTVASTDTDCLDDGEAVSTDPTTDCDDADANDYPGATENVGNGDDEDCDGAEICYLDNDNDGYRPDATSTLTSSDPDCSDSREALSSAPTTDCDDSNASINPAATEITGNNVDEDCNNQAICYLDYDDDGYRPDSTSIYTSTDTDCTDSHEALSSDPTGDCNDSVAAVNPGASETVGNERDDDCSGGAATEVCYYDADDDGQLTDGTSSTLTTVNSADADCSDAYEATSSAAQTDCDDGNSLVYDGATEIVGDEVDQDCDGGEICYLDDDNDGDADEAGTTTVSADEDCQDTDEADDTQPQTDCDDDDATVSGAFGAEGATADGKDNDCDDYYDEGGLLAAGDLVITEIMYDPVAPISTSRTGEWFEVYNASGIDLTLGLGWRVSDGTGTGTVAGVPATIAAGEHAVIAAHATQAQVTEVATYGSVDLDEHPGFDSVTLTFLDPDTGTITIDTVNYADGSFPGGNTDGESLQLSNTGTAGSPTYPADNSDGAGWCFSGAATAIGGGAISAYHSNNTGTPGDENGTCPP